MVKVTLHLNHIHLAPFNFYIYIYRYIFALWNFVYLQLLFLLIKYDTFCDVSFTHLLRRISHYMMSFK